MQLVRTLVLAATLAATFVATACDRDDDRFELVFDDLEASLFSVWGSAPDDMWVVGADPGDGPLVLHYDGDAWTRMDTGASGDLWWVSGRDGEVWMSGEGGLIIRYTRDAGEFEVMEAPDASEELILFGIHPLAADDVWAVGGVRSEGRAYRYDGSAWAEVDDLPAEAGEDALFKVWGRSRDDLWIVGLGEAAFHRSEEGWSVVPTDRRLLTVHGNDDTVIAVGGFGTGYMVESDGDELVDITPAGMEEMIGVWVEPSGDALIAGLDGSIWAREDGAWAPVLERPATAGGLDYHAVFVDSEGGAWAVGGNVQFPPFDHGILSHRGPPISADIR